MHLSVFFFFISDCTPLYLHGPTHSFPTRRSSDLAGTENAYFLQIGWSGEGVELPDANTAWTASAPVLAPDSPVTLSWANGPGQRFEIGLAIDEDYMLTITQRVVNRGEGAVAVRPWKHATREGVAKNPDAWTNQTSTHGTFPH